MTRTSLARAFLAGALLAVVPLAGPRAALKSETAPDAADAAPSTPASPSPATKAPATVPEQECDRLAQPPRAVMGSQSAMSEGVDFANLRWPAARAACARAMAEFPGEVRFVAYAARAADKGGDPKEAARLYRAAAEEGNALAQNNLGAFYERGEGVPRDAREAARLYRASADQAYPAGQANLAVLYAQGRGGLPRDDREAVRLWRLAADQGDVQAANNLGTMYASGRGGLARDMNQAVRWWRAAADQGSTEARGNLRKAGRG